MCGPPSRWRVAGITQRVVLHKNICQLKSNSLVDPLARKLRRQLDECYSAALLANHAVQATATFAILARLFTH